MASAVLGKESILSTTITHRQISSSVASPSPKLNRP